MTDYLCRRNSSYLTNPGQTVNELLRERPAISPEMALRFSRLLETLQSAGISL